LAGSQGMVSLLHLIRLYPGPLPTTFPESMMNWRAVTINQALVLSAPVAWRLAMSGLAMTLVLGLALWAVRVQLGSPRFFAVTLGTWAATAGVAWHSHVHMALPMVAPLLCLYVMGGAPGWLVHLWALAPSLLFLEEAFRTGVGGAHIVAGLGMLAVNSVVLMWAVSTLWSPRGRDQGTSVP
jgi:hypothetical protein